MNQPNGFNQQIRGLTVEEISAEIGLDEGFVKKYLEGPLKEDVEHEKLYLGDGKYDPFTIDIILIQLEVDKGIDNLVKSLEAVRAAKGRKEN